MIAFIVSLLLGGAAFAYGYLNDYNLYLSIGIGVAVMIISWIIIAQITKPRVPTRTAAIPQAAATPQTSIQKAKGLQTCIEMCGKTKLFAPLHNKAVLACREKCNFEFL